MTEASALTCVVVGAGCGGSQPVPAPSVVLSAASASASSPPPTGAVETPPKTPTMRTASAELRRFWTAGDQGNFALYADLGGLLHTEVARLLMPAVLAFAKGQLSEDQSRCLQGAADGLEEVAFGGDDDGLLIVRFDEQVLAPSACFAAVGAQKVELEGAREAYAVDKGVCAYVPGFFLVGSRHAVTAALILGSGATSWPAGLALGPDEYVTWRATIEELRGHGTLLAASDRFRVSLQADLPTEIAKRVENEVQRAKASGALPGLEGQEAMFALRLLQFVDLTRSAGHIDAAFELREPVADQARDFAAIAATMADSVRRYLAHAKAAEARSGVQVIARDYMTWWQREDGKSRARRKLVSFPAVPRTVPRGTRYQSTPEDWKPWDRLKFSIQVPQYYQYEVKAAPNGESAEVIARGDLDGDGKTSLFKLELRVDRSADSALVIAPSIEETDPND